MTPQPLVFTPSTPQCNAVSIKPWYLRYHVDLIAELDHVDHHLYVELGLFELQRCKITPQTCVASANLSIGCSRYHTTTTGTRARPSGIAIWAWTSSTGRSSTPARSSASSTRCAMTPRAASRPRASAHDRHNTARGRVSDWIVSVILLVLWLLLFGGESSRYSEVG